MPAKFKIAIVGQQGVGKSTLANSLNCPLGLHDDYDSARYSGPESSIDSLDAVISCRHRCGLFVELPIPAGSFDGAGRLPEGDRLGQLVRQGQEDLAQQVLHGTTTNRIKVSVPLATESAAIAGEQDFTTCRMAAEVCEAAGRSGGTVRGEGRAGCSGLSMHVWSSRECASCKAVHSSQGCASITLV